MALCCPETGAIQGGEQGKQGSETPASLGICAVAGGQSRFLLSGEAAKFRWKKNIFSNHYISQKELFIHLKYR